MAEKIKGAIFDMDGTLLDSMTEWTHIGARYLRERGICPKSDFERQIDKMTTAQSAAYMKENYLLPETPERIEEEIEALMGRLYRESIPLKPGVEEALHRLRAEGVPMCVATMTETGLARKALERCGVLDCFLEVFGADSGEGKRSPELYLKALARLGTPKEQTWVFEDAPYAVQTAKAAGFPVAAVFDPASASCWEENGRTADRALITLPDFWR